MKINSRLVAVFYPVGNEKDYDRYFRAENDQETYEELIKLTNSRVYELEKSDRRSLCLDLNDLEQDYNDEMLDGGWWMQILSIEEEKRIIGFQIYEKGDFPEDMPDWWIFRNEGDAKLFAEWNEFEEYTIVPIHEGDIEEPELITFDDLVFRYAVTELKGKGITYEDILIWLRDNGVPKTRGCVIADRILNRYNT